MAKTREEIIASETEEFKKTLTEFMQEPRFVCGVGFEFKFGKVLYTVQIEREDA